MKKFLLGLVLWALLPTIAFAQGPVSVCYKVGTGGCVPAVQASSSAVIGISTATTTQIVALAAGKNIFVTSWDGVSSVAGTFQWVYGTGTNCATGTTNLTGAYAFGASTVVTKGNGIGSVLVVPPGNALCAVTTGSINIQGSISYNQM